jgi:tetratricopeptide (TPR) repeat protein
MEEAVFHLEEAIRINPSYVKAHNNLGVALAMQDRHEEAMTVLQSALKVNPAHASTYYNIAVLLHGKGRIEEAMGYYRTALRIRPDFEQARAKLEQAEAYWGRHRSP